MNNVFVRRFPMTAGALQLVKAFPDIVESKAESMKFEAKPIAAQKKFIQAAVGVVGMQTVALGELPDFDLPGGDAVDHASFTLLREWLQELR